MRFLLALVLAALPGGSSAASDRQPFQACKTVAVIMDLEQPFSEASLASMKRELKDIMTSCRVNVVFRMRHLVSNQEAFPGLVLVRFRGSCRPAGRVDASKTHLLAITHVSDGQILPFSEVYCDEIRSVLEAEFDRLINADLDQLFGRALGLVLAHEIYHILAGTAEHAATGITKQTLTAAELLSKGSYFQLEESERILARELPAWEPGPARIGCPEMANE